jgi:hypothetical protein
LNAQVINAFGRNKIDIFSIVSLPETVRMSLCQACQRLALCRAAVASRIRYDYDVLYTVSHAPHRGIPLRVQIITERATKAAVRSARDE